MVQGFKARIPSKVDGRSCCEDEINYRTIGVIKCIRQHNAVLPQPTCLPSIDQLTANRHPGPAGKSGSVDESLNFDVFCPNDDARFYIEAKPVAFGMQMGAMADINRTAVFVKKEIIIILE